MRTKRYSIILLYINTIGCSNYRIVEKTEYKILDNEKPSIRVNLLDGTFYETRNYVFRVDTLIIITPKTLFYKGHTVTIPLENISNIKKQEIDPTDTALLGLGTALLLFFMIEVGSGFGDAFSGI